MNREQKKQIENGYVSLLAWAEVEVRYNPSLLPVLSHVLSLELAERLRLGKTAAKYEARLSDVVRWSKPGQQQELPTNDPLPTDEPTGFFQTKRKPGIGPYYRDQSPRRAIIEMLDDDIEDTIAMGIEAAQTAVRTALLSEGVTNIDSLAAADIIVAEWFETH